MGSTQSNSAGGAGAIWAGPPLGCPQSFVFRRVIHTIFVTRHLSNMNSSATMSRVPGLRRARQKWSAASLRIFGKGPSNFWASIGARQNLRNVAPGREGGGQPPDEGVCATLFWHTAFPKRCLGFVRKVHNSQWFSHRLFGS